MRLCLYLLTFAGTALGVFSAQHFALSAHNVLTHTFYHGHQQHFLLLTYNVLTHIFCHEHASKLSPSWPESVSRCFCSILFLQAMNPSWAYSNCLCQHIMYLRTSSVMIKTPCFSDLSAHNVPKHIFCHGHALDSWLPL